MPNTEEEKAKSGWIGNLWLNFIFPGRLAMLNVSRETFTQVTQKSA